MIAPTAALIPSMNMRSELPLHPAIADNDEVGKLADAVLR
jgi:hypothetical protein